MTDESWPWLRSWFRTKPLRGRVVAMLCMGILLCCAVLQSSPIVAQSFNAGNKLYTKGDFKAAANAFKAALKNESSPMEKAKLHKYAGICEYMLGKTDLAGNNFKKALKLNPAISISQNEVLDESVIGFFNKSKTEVASARPAPAAPRPVRKPDAPAPAVAQVQPPQQGDKALKSKFGKPTKITYLRVTSNVQDATVMVDGILSGNTNTLVEADPGTVVIEVSANGYLSRKIRTKILPNRENMLSVNLVERPKPKPKAPAVVPAKPQALAAKNLPQNTVPGATLAGGKKRGKGKGMKRGDLPDPGGEDLFGDDASFELDGGGRDLTQEFSQDLETVPAKKPKKQLANKGMQPAAAGQMGDVALTKQLPPQQFPQAQPGFSAPQPMSEPPAQAQGANGLALNGNQGMKPQQPMQPIQQQPVPPMPQQIPPQQQQMPQQMPQQQQVAQQPLVQNAPQAPQYAQPYAPPPPPPPPGELQPVYNNQQAVAQGQQQAPGVVKKKKKRSKKLMAQNTDSGRKQMRMTNTSSSGGGSIFISLLPFGAGQFQNGSYILGSVFAGTEVLTLAYWYYNKNLADEAVANADSYYSDVDNSDKTDDEKTELKKEFYDDTKTYVDQKRQQQYIGLFGFGALWIGGAVQSIIATPDPVKPRKIRSSRIAGELEENEGGNEVENENDVSLAIEKRFEPSLMPELNFGVMLDKEHSTPNGVPSAGLGLSAEWKF
jgi:hypothetical protein